MRAPVILPIFGIALRAWWDDDAPRLGASLAYYTLFAIAPGTARRYRDRGNGLRRRCRPRGNCRPARSARGTRRRAGSAESSRGSESTTRWDHRHLCRQHRLRRRCHRSIPRTPGGAEYDLAREAEPGYESQGVRGRSSTLVRPGGGNRFSADGLTRGDGRSGCTKRMALCARPELPAGVERGH